MKTKLNEPIKALVYARVSSKSQETDGNGLDSQETRCREYARLKGYHVEAAFPDTFTGGGDFMKRPGMVALLSYLDAQPSEKYVVIFDDLKRFARDTRFHLNLRDAFRSRSASIECLNFNFEDSPEGEFAETIMAAHGTLERKQNGRQVTQKMKARMQNGYWVHAKPVGYKTVIVKGRGKVLFPNEPLATVVREAFEGFASGRFGSQAEVRRFFELHPDFPRNKKGEIPNQRAADVLKNPLYTGHICSETYGIDWLKGQHEALISIELFDKVQDRLKGSAKVLVRKNIGNDFAARGFVSCGDCGGPLSSSWPKGRDRSYAYYLCQSKGCASYGKSIPRDKLEGDIGALIKTLHPSQNLFELVKVMFRDAWTQRLAQADEIVKSGKTQIKAIEKQVDALLGRIIDTTNPTVIRAYEGKINELERSKTKLQDQLAHHNAPTTDTFEEKLEPALQFLANPWKLWESGQITLRRMVLKLAFTDRITYHRNQGARTTKIALPFKALGGVLYRESNNGASAEIRTRDLCLRRAALYPAELRVHCCCGLS